MAASTPRPATTGTTTATIEPRHLTGEAGVWRWPPRSVILCTVLDVEGVWRRDLRRIERQRCRHPENPKQARGEAADRLRESQLADASAGSRRCVSRGGPGAAVENIHAMTRPRGWAMVATPFLFRVHAQAARLQPSDAGLKQLMVKRRLC